MKDVVTLVKADGRRFDKLQASVQTDLIITRDPNIPIEEGDTLERPLPNGIIERYTVLDAGFHQGIAGIKPHYQSQVRKETKIERERPAPQVIYNLTGPNARINVQSVDASSNVVGVDSDELFEKLRTTIAEHISDEIHVNQLIGKLNELEQAKGKATFIQRYQEFIALAANHVTLLAPYIPALTQLLP